MNQLLDFSDSKKIMMCLSLCMCIKHYLGVVCFFLLHLFLCHFFTSFFSLLKYVYIAISNVDFSSFCFVTLLFLFGFVHASVYAFFALDNDVCMCFFF